MRGGGAEGACGPESVVGSQASQCGLRVRPAKGVGSRVRLGRGGGGSGVVGHTAMSLSHAHWSMTHSHTRATSISWEKKRAATMAKPPPTSGERGVFYPNFMPPE